MEIALITSIAWLFVFAFGFFMGYDKKKKEVDRLLYREKEDSEDEIVEKAKLIHRRRKALPKVMIKRKDLCKK